MAKEYKVGERYYLPVTVNRILNDNCKYPVGIEYVDSDGYDTTEETAVGDEPNLLLTADEIAMVINTERDDALAELKARNAELEALLKEVMATRDEAIRQNDELRKENDNLKSQVGKKLTEIQDLNAEVHFLKEKSGKPTEEATKHAHVVLNDGTELAFTQKDTIAFYMDDVDMLFISDGDGVIAGFNRGDKPFNFAYFY